MMGWLQDYLRKLDPATNVGLSADSIDHYTVGEVCRSKGISSFLARDSIYAIARYMPSPVRLAVRPSVRHTGGSVKDGWS